MQSATPGALVLVLSAPVSPQLDIEVIRQAAGTPITVTDDDVARMGWLREDVPVTIDGSRFRPQAGLGSWAAFKAMPNGMAMVMGDTVVFEDEITPAMDAAFGHGLDVTALHNHFIFDRPPVYFMHIGGMGDEATLATGVRAIWDAIKAVRREHPEPRAGFDDRVPDQTGDFDVASLERILEGKASVGNGIVKFTFGHTASMNGVAFGASMGLATWAAFSGNRNVAIVDGDFAMTAHEVQTVLRTLRRSDIHIVALHNHMIGEEPAFYFLHYWGKGSAADLARGLRAAMNAQATAAARRGTDGAKARATNDEAHETIWRFDDTPVGRLPDGWRSDATLPDGKPNPWTVRVDPAAVSGDRVLALPGTPRFRNGTFNLCRTDRVRFRDGAISVRVRAGTGQVDRGGGPIWRVQDANNYYVARWNPLEDNFRVYYVKDGRRVQLASAEVRADPTGWHTIAIEHRGDAIECSFDGTRLLTLNDATITREGGVGVWSKADAASSFDDLEVTIKDAGD